MKMKRSNPIVVGALVGALMALAACGNDDPSGPAGEFTVSLAPDPIQWVGFNSGHGNITRWADFSTVIHAGNVGGDIVSIETTVTDRTGDILYHSVFSGAQLRANVCQATSPISNCEFPTRQNTELPAMSIVAIKQNPLLSMPLTAIRAIVKVTIRDDNGHQAVHEVTSQPPAP